MKSRLKLALLVAVSLGVAACGGGRSSSYINADLRAIRGTDTNGNGVRDDVEAKIRKFSTRFYVRIRYVRFKRGFKNRQDYHGTNY